MNAAFEDPHSLSTPYGRIDCGTIMNGKCLIRTERFSGCYQGWQELRNYRKFASLTVTCEDAKAYQAYQESHESDPPDIRDGFWKLDILLGHLPLEDNNAVFNLCCNLCTAYEHKAFWDGLEYGAHLMQELFVEESDKNCDIFVKNAKKD